MKFVALSAARGSQAAVWPVLAQTGTVFALDGRSVLVTGGSKGIGQTITVDGGQVLPESPDAVSP